MTCGQGGGRNHVAGAEEVVSRRDVVTRFIPIVGQPQQREVREVNADEEQGKNQPEGKRMVELSLLFCKYGLESLLLSPAPAMLECPMHDSSLLLEPVFREWPSGFTVGVDRS